ncbi:MAG: DUF3043 domain-containing protein [Micrococcales bacterium]|nr:DUF3043 domain-containing protein [Micrococcales bacterium]
MRDSTDKSAKGSKAKPASGVKGGKPEKATAKDKPGKAGSKAKAKQAAKPPAEEVIDTRPPGQRAKGRATPSRKEVEKAKAQPFVGKTKAKTSSMTKEQRRKASQEARERYAHAMRTGEERYLPARDRGPIKRWTRNYIDSRRSMSEYLIFITLGMLVFVMVLQSSFPALAGLGLLGMYLIIFIVIGEAYFKARRLRQALYAKFGQDNVPKGSVRYGVVRSFQFRRSRQPKPQVKVGEDPG